MKKKTLQERLAAYLRNRPNQKIAKGFLADLARHKGGYTGETVGRRLRVLHEASTMTDTLAEMTSPEHVKARTLLEGGVIQVEHRDKNHCYYWYEPPATRRVRKVVIKDNVAHEIWVDETTK